MTLEGNVELSNAFEVIQSWPGQAERDAQLERGPAEDNVYAFGDVHRAGHVNDVRRVVLAPVRERPVDVEF